MSGFADLVTQGQPALYGGGVSNRGTAGRTWLWEWVDVNDIAGDPIDLTAVTGTCVVADPNSGEEVLSLDFTGGIGSFAVGASEEDTASAAVGTFVWSLVLKSGGQSVQAWGSSDSPFVIEGTL